MTIVGTPRRADPSAPPVNRKSLVRATVRKDMGRIPPEKAKELLETFEPTITRVLQRVSVSSIQGLDKEDLHSIGQIAILEAYVRYEADAKAALSTWVNRLVRWRIMEAINIAFRGGREQLGHHVDRDVTAFALDDADTWSHRRTRALQLRWVQVMLERHFTPKERALLLKQGPPPKTKRARDRLKQQRYKIRERLMALALEAGVIRRDRPRPGCHFIVHLTDDVPLVG